MNKCLVLAGVLAVGLAWADPNPFADYGSAMAHHDGYSMAVEWQQGNTTIAAETSDEALAAVVADQATAQSLLASLKPAYASDPLVLTKVAAVSQWVMLDDPWYCLFWNGPHAAGREVWTAALLASVRTAKDATVAQLCLEQLRWCGRPEQAEEIRTLVRAWSDKALRDFAEMVAQGLEQRQ